MQPPCPPTAPAAQRQGPKHRQRVTGMRPPRHGGAAGAPAVPGTCSGTLGGHRALGRLHSGAAALPGWAVRSRAPAPDGGARLEGCHHPRAAPALPVWLWPQTARGLGLSFPTTEPHGGCAEAGSQHGSPWLGSRGRAERVLPPPGPGWPGASMPTLEVGRGRAERRWLPRQRRRCLGLRAARPHTRPGPGSPQCGRAPAAAPSRRTPPHTHTHRAAPRPRTLTTTVMPLFSSGALS